MSGQKNELRRVQMVSDASIVRRGTVTARPTINVDSHRLRDSVGHLGKDVNEALLATTLADPLGLQVYQLLPLSQLLCAAPLRP